MTVKLLNSGARKTHTSRMSMVMLRAWSTWWSTDEVSMRPGKIVPPIMRPSGYHAVASNQLWNW